MFPPVVIIGNTEGEGIVEATRISVLKRILGILLILVGLLALLTPLTPGSWLIIVGAELLGIRLLAWEKVRRAIAARFFESRQRTAATLAVGALTTILVGAGSYWLWQRFVFPTSQSDTPVSPSALPDVLLRVGQAEVRVEIARTPSDQARGLGGRRSLPANTGMLFVFESAADRVFWMKDTHIPLDLLWIRDGKIVGITANVQPEPGVPDALLRRYDSPGPVDQVLEVNAGWSAQYGVRIGDLVPLRDGEISREEVGL